MRATTFGDLLVVADSHWAEAMEWLEPPASSWQVRDRSTVDELGQVALVLARYAERAGTGFSPQGRETEVAQRAKLCAASLRNAASFLQENGDGSPAYCSLARNLYMARQALGCGLDLLSTHFEVDSGRLLPATAQSKIISSASSAEWLLTAVEGYTAGLLRIVEKAGRTDASARLTEAIRHAKSRTNPDDQALRAMTMPEPRAALEKPVDVPEPLPKRVPLREGERRGQALAGMRANARWLQASGVPENARTLRSLATSTLMTSEISGQTLRLLMARCRQLDLPEAAGALAEAEMMLGELVDRWAEVTTMWRDVSCDRRARLDQMVVDAGELVVRLGRLAYADRTWKPSANAVTKLVRPQVLAPGTADVRMIAQAMEATTRVSAVVASGGLTRLAVGGMRGLTSQGRTQMKLRHERLSKHYAGARDVAAEAQKALGKATRVLDSLDERGPGRLAAENFPLQTREALGIAGPEATRTRGARAARSPRPALG